MSLWLNARAPARSRTASHSLHGRPVARSTAAVPTPARRSSFVPVGSRPAAAFRGRGRASAFRIAGLRATGTRVPGLRAVARLSSAPLEEEELLEEVHVLLVLHQRAVKRRDRGLVA